MKVALLQANPLMGDICGNLQKLFEAHKTVEGNADVLIASECFLTGYPMEDLVLRPEFMDKVHKKVEQLKEFSIGKSTAIVAGFPYRIPENGEVYNAIALFDNGGMQIRFKHHRPNYDVFDEKRIFEFAPLSWQSPVDFRGLRVGLMVCEDVWYSDVSMFLAGLGAKVFFTIHGSPFVMNKVDIRESVICKRVKETGVPFVYVNQVCGQDELVFDGASFVMTQNGVVYLPQFEEALKIVEWDLNNPATILENENHRTEISYTREARNALVFGIKEYVNKNRFPGVVIGLSGGIDSAVTAAIAVEALGADRVHGILMPGPHSSNHSVTDALSLARNLKISYDIVEINDVCSAMYNTMGGVIDMCKQDVTQENIQARVRGMILMAYSNRTGYMVLTTGNKSEMSVGYATLYGDMNGGFNALKDVNKLLVFALAEDYNEIDEIIPYNTINKPPSAELAPDQKDEDSLPPYDILVPILTGLVEDEKSIEQIATELMVDVSVVSKIQNMLYRAEYKRRQACPGTKITKRSFGKDRRYPIVNKYRDGDE